MDLTRLLAQRSPILLDGAMGTQLAAAGLEMGGQNCLSHPEAVVAVHQAYVQAGCQGLTTNTLTMNRIYLETHGLSVSVEEVNRRAVELARSAAPDGCFVLGNLSSTGQMLEPYGDYTEEQFRQGFREQAGHLLAGGIDGFLIETMMDLREARCALEACRELSPLPVLVTISFQTAERGGRTLMGDTAGQVATTLAEAGAAAVGANCGSLDPAGTARVLGMMREVVDLPLVAQPNAGAPRLVDGLTVFDMPPEAFAEGIAACLAAGATLVGGCCGSTPEHLRRVRELLAVP